jgi:hypothetical protein
LRILDGHSENVERLPRMSLDIKDDLVYIKDNWANSQESLRGLLGSAEIDEMAVYFAHEVHLLRWMSLCVREGWQLFNTDTDRVQVQPIPADYAVQYWFLRKEGEPYRLELMMVQDGFSPYHNWLEWCASQERGRRRPIPTMLAHASFKCATEAEYGTAVHLLRSHDYNPMQLCLSNYGRFSYWREGVGAGKGMPPLKPRLNTRDVPSLLDDLL